MNIQWQKPAKLSVAPACTEGVRVYTLRMSPTLPMMTLDWSLLFRDATPAAETLDAMVQWVRSYPRPQALRVVLPHSRASQQVTTSLARTLQTTGCTITRRIVH